jgi:TolB-like protein/Flp pilus assembly protein TadD/aminoglycoside phosphotransferase (APT) family kinase protein
MNQPDRARWQAVQQLVDDALDRPTAERAAFLQKASAGDELLRAEAARLLASCERASRSDILLADSAALFAAPLLNAPADRVSAALQAASQGRYVIERELARGGMATVYVALDQRHDRRVAVKVLEHHVHTAGVERFLREIRTTARLTHPHLLGLHDSGESEGFLFYVMPYVDGETLRARLARAGALPVAESVRLIREIADALAYAHKHGLAHRDLKPENVLLADGHAMVADFGIAKALAAAAGDDGAKPGMQPADPHATVAGGVLGTPAYMAPEQADGAGAIDQRVDLYALGVIAYEMLAGKHPFGRRTAQAMVDAHRREDPAPLAGLRPDTPPWLGQLVGELMAKSPAQRPQSADEITRRIDDANSTTERLGSERRRRLPVLPIAAAVLLLAMGGAYWLRGAATRDTAPAGVSPARITQPITTVAVLPFANTSSRADDQYFSEGLTDELALALARLPGVRVAGRTSTFAFKGRQLPAQEIGRSLDVGALVTGATRRANGRVRVSIQLVSAADGKVLWGSVYESRSNDVFQIQDEFTRAVVTALAPSLGSSAQSAALPSSRGTIDQEAYDLYLRGRYYWLERGRANVEQSIQQLRRAVERDPSFARAHAALSLSYGTYPTYVPDAMDTMATLMTVHAQRAIALDANFADAQLAIGQALELELRYPEALEHYQRALALEPSNATVHHWLGAFLVSLGRIDEGVATLRRGTILDPLAKSLGSAYSASLLFARRLPEATAAARAVLVIDSTFPLPYWMLAMAAAMEGKTDEAVQALERRRHLAPQMGGLEVALLYVYASGGRWAEADRTRGQLERPADKAVAALIYGDREPLIRLLATADGKREWVNLNLVFGCHPYLDPLWSDARFLADMKRLGVAPCKLARPWRFRPPAAARATAAG